MSRNYTTLPPSAAMACGGTALLLTINEAGACWKRTELVRVGSVQS